MIRLPLHFCQYVSRVHRRTEQFLIRFLAHCSALIAAFMFVFIHSSFDEFLPWSSTLLQHLSVCNLERSYFHVPTSVCFHLMCVQLLAICSQHNAKRLYRSCFCVVTTRLVSIPLASICVYPSGLVLSHSSSCVAFIMDHSMTGSYVCFNVSMNEFLLC